MTAPHQPAPDGAYVIGGDNGSGSGYNYGQDMTEAVARSLYMPVVSFVNQIGALAQNLLKMPLDVLKTFQQFIPGATNADFIDVPTAVDKIIDWFTGLGKLVTEGAMNALKAIIDQILAIFNGIIVDPIDDAIGALLSWFGLNKEKTQNLTNSGTMPADAVHSPFDLVGNIGEDLYKFANGWWNGVTGESATDKTADDVEEAARTLKSQASDASATANFAASMVIRPRRSQRWISTGTHDDVSFPIVCAQTLWTPTLGDITFIPITADTDRPYKTFKFGLVGSSMTNCYAGVYRLSTDGTLTLISNLGDVKSLLTATKVQSFQLPEPITASRGETLFGAVRQVGGTAGQFFTTPALAAALESVQPIPLYLTEKLNTGTGLPATISAALTRSESSPVWGALGETLLDSLWVDYTAPGEYDFDIPELSRYIYIAGSSAGGGGGGGDGGFGRPGGGGRRGQWTAIALERGVGIPWEVTQLKIIVPDGGEGSPSKETNGVKGGDLIVQYTLGGITTTLLFAPGGARGRLAFGGVVINNPVGEAQINYPFFGRLFVGGAEASQDQVGNDPGGGGGGGAGGFFGSANAGKKGGPGFAAIRTA